MLGVVALAVIVPSAVGSIEAPSGPARGEEPTDELASSSSPAGAEADRIALVIGVKRYAPPNDLRNPVNDAKAIADKARELNFLTLSDFDVDIQGFLAMLRTLEQQGSGKRLALIYFAGHGVERAGENYLIPADASLTAELHLARESVRITEILQSVAVAGIPAAVVIVDACRDNSFPLQDLGTPTRSPSVGRGLGDFRPPSGVVIGYATEPGGVASDGTGEHGLYTEALLGHMDQPGLSVEELMKRVGRDVRERSRNEQIPFYRSSIDGFVTLRDLKSDLDYDKHLWDLAQTHYRQFGKLLLINQYLLIFPNGLHREEAQDLLRQTRVVPTEGGGGTPPERIIGLYSEEDPRSGRSYLGPLVLESVEGGAVAVGVAPRDKDGAVRVSAAPRGTFHPLGRVGWFRLTKAPDVPLDLDIADADIEAAVRGWSKSPDDERELVVVSERIDPEGDPKRAQMLAAIAGAESYVALHQKLRALGEGNPRVSLAVLYSTEEALSVPLGHIRVTEGVTLRGAVADELAVASENPQVQFLGGGLGAAGAPRSEAAVE